MQIAVAWSVEQASQTACRDVLAQLKAELTGVPSLLFVYSTVSHDNGVILKAIRSVFSAVPVHGGTSCVGVMSDAGFHSSEGFALGILAIADPEGAYGVGAATLTGGGHGAAMAAAEQAMLNAGRPGEVPAEIWMTCAPGSEEEVLAGLAEFFGPGVPVSGGSSADHTIAGEWQQFCNAEAHRNAVVISTFYPSTPIHFLFHSGYEPAGPVARVTKSHGRVIEELDHQPAAQVYDQWLGGALANLPKPYSSIMALTTLRPLGRTAGRVGGVDFFPFVASGDADRWAFHLGFYQRRCRRRGAFDARVAR